MLQLFDSISCVFNINWVPEQAGVNKDGWECFVCIHFVTFGRERLQRHEEMQYLTTAVAPITMIRLM